MAPRETENNAYGKVWGDKQRALMYVMYFWSGQFSSQRLIYHIFFIILLKTST